MSWYAAIEAGGTKFLCAIADREGQLLQQTRFATRDPAQTIQQVLAFFRPQLEQSTPLGLGIASFGPLNLDINSASYGRITRTPKPGWAQFDLLGQLRQHFACPSAIDTDVNAAALAEYRWGAGQGCDPLIYLTVGTGVGGGVIVRGAPMRGLIHPEMGHLRVPRLVDDPFPGACPFHGDCIEGLCSGPALALRRGIRAEDWAADDPEWLRLAHYLGVFVAQLLLCFSPQRILIGGGVMARHQLLTAIRQAALTSLADYLDHPQLQQQSAAQAGKQGGDWLAQPGLGGESGLRGALALAMDAALNPIKEAIRDETQRH